MSMDTAVLDRVAPAATTEVDPVNVTITFHPDLTYTVDITYILVPENTTQTIVWTIDPKEVPAGLQVAFDTPAITLFGGLDSIPRKTPLTAELEWTNTPETAGQSFFYRIHMFGVKFDDEGNIIQYFAINHDPTIHNDPPSAP